VFVKKKKNKGGHGGPFTHLYFLILLPSPEAPIDNRGRIGGAVQPTSDPTPVDEARSGWPGIEGANSNRGTKVTDLRSPGRVQETATPIEGTGNVGGRRDVPIAVRRQLPGWDSISKCVAMLGQGGELVISYLLWTVLL